MSQAAASGAQRPHLRLQLLGGFSLQREGVEQQLPRGGQRLLAHLALQSGRGRELTAGALWPEVTAAHALGSLRSSLWRLQRAGVPVRTTGPSLTLPDDVLVDVHELQRVLRSEWAGGGPRSGVDVEGDAWLWSSSDADLLPGWYDDWVLLERERLRQLRLHVGEGLAERLREAGRYAAAVQVALTVVGLEPLRESAHRSVIRIHLAEGNVGEALRQYRSCCTLLRDELGIGPSPLLQALVHPLPTPRRPVDIDLHTPAWPA